MAPSRVFPLISVDELRTRMETGDGLRLLDVRYRLDQPDGRADHHASHLPGAVYVDMDTELATHGEPSQGRHPVPSREVLQDAARRWGLCDGDTVVIYDDYRSVSAARAWWLLTHSGVHDVRVLDGGLSAWTAASLPLEAGATSPARGSITLDDLNGDIATIDDAEAWPARGILLDARAPERYRGETEPYDPIAGHIPGAVNLPAGTYLDGERFAQPDAIHDALAAAGVTDQSLVAAYCGSGLTAAHLALAATVAGVDVTVFPGSWSQWSNTPGRPVAIGPTPGEVVTA
ncbi:sulfurtransferase (plasmid) [Coraliomargarita sp. W4R53]